MQYQTILFDFDYTLADTTVGIINSFHYAFDRLHIDRRDDDSIRKTIGMPLKAAFTALTGLQDARLQEQFHRYFVTSSNAIMTRNTVLYKDTIDVLKQLKKQSCQIAIISTKYHFRIDESIEKFNLYGLIDLVIGGEDVTAFKPSPEGCLKAIKQLNSNLDQTVFIGDSLIDAQTSKNAGIAFVGVMTGTDQPKDFEGYSYLKLCHSLTQAAAFICK